MGNFRGVPIDSLFSNGTCWDYHTPPIRPNTYHKVLYEFPIDLKTVPKPRRSYKGTFRDEDHVRLPYIEKGGTSPGRKPYWELVQEALLQPIRNSRQLEAVIKSYVGIGPKFSALHDLFDHNFTEDETEEFFRNVLPEIIRLALNLPNILPGNVPYLKSGSNRSISLSQYQISSLLANAFLCTFNHKYKRSKDNNNQHIVRVAGINFDRLFSEQAKHSAVEKIKCLVYYFKRIVTERPIGAVTFERKHLPRNQLARCDISYDPIKILKIHISSDGTIEDNGQGFLQVDFANKFIGGGVLGHGCVQEEIRFVICPELIISRLFTEELKDNEALLMIGAEQFSKYIGYGDTFQWAGGINDQTPYDVINGRRKTSIIAIDAVPFHNTRDQFKSGWIRREFHKAFVGFQQYQEHSPSKDTVLPKLGPVATGNWGCGAFRGDPHLKWLIQLMAATMSKRDLVYFTFNDRVLMEELWEMYEWIVNENIQVKQLWRLMCTFLSTNLPSKDLFPHIQEMHIKSRTQPCVLDSFKNLQQKSLNSKLEKVEYSPLNIQQATSSKIKNYDSSFIENKDSADIRKQRNVDFLFEKSTENMDIDDVEMDSDDNSIDLTKLSTSKRKLLSNEQQIPISFNEHEDDVITSIKKSSTEVDGVLDIINLLHGDRNDRQQKPATKTFFDVVDALSKKSENSMSTEFQSVDLTNDIDTKDMQQNSKGSVSTAGVSSKCKITDYFCRVEPKK